MGVNIIPYKITGEREEDGWLKVDGQGNGREVFDSHGERAFMREVEIDWEHIEEAPDDGHSMGHSYQRPKDIDKAMQQSIEFGRQDIADLFEKMKTDSTLWIFISY